MVTNGKLRVAVVGCGRHGVTGHLANYARFADVEIVAVCDANADRVAAAAAEYHVPHAYTDYRALFANHRLDIVSVCTPPASHRAITVDAFAAGAHVLCEKPLAMNAAEAEEMIAAANRAGRFLSMGLQSRYHPEARYLRRFLVEGGIGRVFHSRVWCGHVMNIPGTGVFHRKDLSGGGVIYATAVHIVDVALWMLGNPTPRSVSASILQRVSRMPNPPITWPGTLQDNDVEDFAIGFVRFADGSTMTVEANWLAHPSTRVGGVHYLGEKGSADYHPLRIEIEDGAQVRDATPTLEASREWVHPLEPVLRDFVECVREKRVPIVRFREMLDTQRIMDAMYRSAETGEEVRVT